jgi:hypothetical protein
MKSLNFMGSLQMVVVLLIIVLGVQVFGTPVAQAASVGTTFVYTQAGIDNGDNQTSIGPLPRDYLNFSEDRSGMYMSSYGPAEWQAIANAQSLLGGGPLGGSGYVNVNATVTVTNTKASAAASAKAEFYFLSKEKSTPSFTPSLLPVSFSAFGSGSIAEGAGRFEALVTLGIPNLTGNAYHIAYEGLTHQDQFQQTTTFWLPIGVEYVVTVLANAWAYNSAYAGQSARSSVFAEADPIIFFDQAAFDAQYSGSSFKLSDYYELEFSPNAVPIPGAVWLLGSGLAGIIGFKKIQRNKRT